MRFFGTGIRELRKPAGTVTITCEQCHRSAVHSVTAQHSWITILYVGVIPLGRQSFTVCSGCNQLARMDKRQAEYLQSPV